MSIADTAIRMAAKGRKIFPCRPGQKTPLTSRGFKDATDNEAAVREWWAANPDANIGLPTGEENAVWVLDVDAKSGGVETFYSLQEKFGRLPDTLQVRTGGGGFHFYFNWPDNGTSIRSRAGIRPGLDTRGTGGYVLAPGSVTQAPYTLVGKHGPADAPEWLLQLVGETNGSGHRDNGNSDEREKLKEVERNSRKPRAFQLQGLKCRLKGP